MARNTQPCAVNVYQPPYSPSLNSTSLGRGTRDDHSQYVLDKKQFSKQYNGLMSQYGIALTRLFKVAKFYYSGYKVGGKKHDLHFVMRGRTIVINTQSLNDALSLLKKAIRDTKYYIKNHTRRGGAGAGASPDSFKGFYKQVYAAAPLQYWIQNANFGDLRLGAALDGYVTRVTIGKLFYTNIATARLSAGGNNVVPDEVMIHAFAEMPYTVNKNGRTIELNPGRESTFDLLNRVSTNCGISTSGFKAIHFSKISTKNLLSVADLEALGNARVDGRSAIQILQDLESPAVADQILQDHYAIEEFRAQLKTGKAKRA